jgi:hypothetical protein
LTFLLGEDKALRLKLQGITVHDQKADGQDVPRQVGVWFGQPDQEVRAQNFPYVTIDMVDINRDTTREHRGLVDPEYLAPEGLTPEQGWVIHMPIPVNIDYQITTYARHPRHDREMLTQILFEKLPIRFGALEVIENVVVDGETTTTTSTMRRLDVLASSKRDSTEQAKRLFVNVISVRVSSEISLDSYKQLYKALSVTVDEPILTRDGFIGVGQISNSA